jgi:alkylated DNA repair dioxygenase AlkB
MTASQFNLFEAAGAQPADARPAEALPDGFRYQPDFVTQREEESLIEHVQGLPFKPFEFHGFLGKRRVVSFGWRYDFSSAKLHEAGPIPEFLMPIRERAAAFAGLEPRTLAHVLVTEYSPGTTINWHKDRPFYEDVIGVSLVSECVFRLRRKAGANWQRRSIGLAPRSVYLLRGPVRTDWEHSIPAVASLRYSITFRNLRRDGEGENG